MPEDEEGKEEKWQAECDCDTLMKAEEIKADKSRLKAAMMVATDRHEAMKKVMSGTMPMSKKGMK